MAMNSYPKPFYPTKINKKSPNILLPGLTPDLTHFLYETTTVTSSGVSDIFDKGATLKAFLTLCPQ